jgi:hypothetical protein
MNKILFLVALLIGLTAGMMAAEAINPPMALACTSPSC